jgi:N6-L-threonylcarbamoyladenine synthase
MTVLGIETSCDETSAAVLVDGEVRSNVISSQLVHARYGGVVPELASRAHQRLIIEVVEEALRAAGITRKEIQAVAATRGPGLAGALLVGLTFAKALAYGMHVPFIGVNHMEGHLYSNFLSPRKPEYPFLSLIVSGGHTMLVFVEAPLRHRVLGQTRDDAAGEAFDKVAKMLGLGYPGGPAVQKCAQDGNLAAIRFPRALAGSPDFSFSGIKTAVLYHLRDQGLLGPDTRALPMPDRQRADICASFQSAVVETLVEKTLRAAEEVRPAWICVAGGVSANAHLRSRMEEEGAKRRIPVSVPPMQYCMDNGAMIALAGWMHLRHGETGALDTPAVPNLSLAG